MENDSKNIFFNISIMFALLGFMLYFVQEIILWTGVSNILQYGVPITVIISDGFMIITIILAIILLFVGLNKTKLFRVVILMAGLHFLTYTLAHMFYPFFANHNWSIPLSYNIIELFTNDGLSFIVLLILGLASLFVIVFSSINMDHNEISMGEKFSYITTLGIMIVFNNTCLHIIRYELVGSGIPFYGFFIIPIILEMIILIALVILLSINAVVRETKIISILGLILFNIFLIGIVSSASVGTTFDFTIDITYALANTLLVLGTVLTFISSIIMVNKKMHAIPAK